MNDVKEPFKNHLAEQQDAPMPEPERSREALLKLADLAKDGDLPPHQAVQAAYNIGLRIGRTLGAKDSGDTFIRQQQILANQSGVNFPGR